MDLLLVREGRTLAKYVRSERGSLLKCQIIFWNTGDDVLKIFQEHVI